MTLSIQALLDDFLKIASSLIKMMTAVGCLGVIAYCLRIGQFPQGISLGDSILLLTAALCLGAVYGLFVMSLVGLGICMQPIVHAAVWLAKKIHKRMGHPEPEPVYALARVTWFAVSMAFVSIIMITALGQRRPEALWILPLLALALYFFYSVSVSAWAKWRAAEQIIRRAVDPNDIQLAATRDEVERFRGAFFVASLIVCIVPIFLSGVGGEILDASMRAAGVRIERSVVHISEPYVGMLPASLVAKNVRSPQGHAAFKDIVVLFNQFGTTTTISFQEGPFKRIVNIPNEKIVIERQ